MYCFPVLERLLVQLVNEKGNPSVVREITRAIGCRGLWLEDPSKRAGKGLLGGWKGEGGCFRICRQAHPVSSKCPP